MGSRLGPYELNNIYCGECAEMMAVLPDNCIDFWLTSPPYGEMRAYNGYTFDFERIAAQLYRVTKEGGVGVWVVADETTNFCESLTSFKQAIYFVDTCGFNLFDTMIYKKRGLEFPRHNHKNYPAVFEYMFVFSKGAPGTSNLIMDRPNSYTGDKIWGSIRNPDGSQKFTHSQGRVIKDYGYRGNIWEFDAGYMKNTKDAFAHTHPAIFPEALARDHILSWSNPGDVVLDPMMGSGTVGKMCALTGRNYLGFDISPEYVELARRRVANVEAQPFLMPPTVETNGKPEQTAMDLASCV